MAPLNRYTVAWAKHSEISHTRHTMFRTTAFPKTSVALIRRWRPQPLRG
jgi:hypothetical protein